MSGTGVTRTVHPAERCAELSTGRYRYLEWGDRETSPTVVLLHGRTSLADTWLDVAAALADEWHVLAFEQRGHGDSPWDADGRYNLIDFLTDYEEFVEKVVGGPHLLIGHSMGSCTSLVYASRHPELVHALVLEDGGPSGPTVENAVADDLATSPRSFGTWEDARLHVGEGHPHMSGAVLDERVDRSVRPGEGGRYYWRADVHNLLSDRHFDELLDAGQWRAVEALAVDTIFLWADSPHLVEPEVVDRMVEMNPRIRKVVFHTGHSIHEERLDLFLDEVLPFLRAHRNDAA